MVGDRGMITDARIDEELRPRGVDWITALRAPTIRKLMKEGGPLQLSLFDQQDLAEIRSPDFPGERLVACRNPLLAEDRARKRQELLEATEEKLAKVQARTRRERRPLRGEDAIGVEVGKVLGASKVAKHFRYQITEDSLHLRAERALHRSRSGPGWDLRDPDQRPRSETSGLKRWFRPTRISPRSNRRSG